MCISPAVDCFPLVKTLSPVKTLQPLCELLNLIDADRQQGVSRWGSYMSKVANKIEAIA